MLELGLKRSKADDCLYHLIRHTICGWTVYNHIITFLLVRLPETSAMFKLLFKYNIVCLFSILLLFISHNHTLLANLRYEHNTQLRKLLVHAEHTVFFKQMDGIVTIFFTNRIWIINIGEIPYYIFIHFPII